MNALAPLPSTLSSNELHGFLRSRRSIRFYKPNVPDPVVLERLFLTAGMAPSAHNRQPWRYAVIVETGDKQKLAEAMGDRLVQDRTRDGDTEDAIKADVERSYRRVVDAPVVVIVALTLADMDRYPDAARMRAEYLMAVQSTAMATQNLLLAAHAEGLGACWMCAPLFCPDTVRAVLKSLSELGAARLAHTRLPRAAREAQASATVECVRPRSAHARSRRGMLALPAL